MKKSGKLLPFGKIYVNSRVGFVHIHHAMKKSYVSPLVSEIETGVELGFCLSNGEAGGVVFGSDTGTSGYYDEEN